MSDKSNPKAAEPPSPLTAKRSSLWRAACLLPVLSVLIVHGLFPPERIHEDEVYWIGSTYYLHLAVDQRDASHPDWMLLPARENPALGKYVLGSGMRLLGESVETPDILGSFYLIFAGMPGAWGEGDAFEKRRNVALRVDPEFGENVLRGVAPPLSESQLNAGRLVSLVFGMLAACGLCVLGQQCEWRWGGLLAGVLFSCHPIVLSAYSLAMIDIIAIAFCIWFLVGILALLKLGSNTTRNVAADQRSDQKGRDGGRKSEAKNESWSWGRAALIAIPTCLALAFACGSKMNSLVVAGVATLIALWLGAQAWQGDEPATHRRKLIARLMLLLFVGCIAGVIFVGTNPSLYADPVDGVLALSYEHQLTADIQEKLLGGRLRTISQRLSAIAILTCGSHLLFALLACTTLGLGIYCARTRSLGIVIAIWWFVALALLLLWLPFGWDRYVIPILAPSALVIGATLDILGHLAWGRLRSPS